MQIAHCYIILSAVSKFQLQFNCKNKRKCRILMKRPGLKSSKAYKNID